MAFEEYSAKVMDHFLNPRHTGEVVAPTHSALAENPVCGDMMKLTLRVEAGMIREAKAKTFGCAAAIACASAVTEMLMGRTVAEARAITDDAVVTWLGGLPDHKVKCSLVAEQVLREALK